MNDFFILQEIAYWQQHNNKSKEELPFIQGGFVWNPKQVEDLGDSLLRGYPIVSFLFSNSESAICPISSSTALIWAGGFLNRNSYFIHI